VIIYQQNLKTGKWEISGRTEMVKDNLNPNFVKTLDVNFIFEIKQLLKFDVIDVDDEKENSNDFDIIGND
jgi:hypothetical protein